MREISNKGHAVADLAEGLGETVVLLHSTGASSQQWRTLVGRLSADFHVIAPDLYGYGDAAAWPGERAFALADEAAVVHALLDRVQGPSHLVGHSYGGAVALQVARQRSHALSSLTLIEPAAFHLLHEGDASDLMALAEIQAVAKGVWQSLACGDLHGGFGRFVDYWSGAGAWSRVPVQRQAAMAAAMGKVALDFHATINEPSRVVECAHIAVPTLLMQGGLTTLPARRICHRLARVLPNARRRTIAGAGHMLPITHRDEVNDLIVAHLAASHAALRPAGMRLAA